MIEVKFHWSRLWWPVLLMASLASPLAAQQTRRGEGPPPAPVEVSSVVEKEVISRVGMIGNAEAWIETVVAAQESGRVEKILVEEGDFVKENQLLCEQDTSRILLEIQSAGASLDEARALHEQARREWERQKRLYDIKSVSERDYENARFEAEASLKKVAGLKADLAVLQDRLEKREVRAPLPGYIVRRHALVGQWLDEGNPVVTLAVLDPIRLEVPVPERYIASVKVGEKAEVRFDALKDRVFEGTIRAVVPLADPATRAFPVHIEISNPGTTIKAGMLGRAVIPTGEYRKALLVPKDALVLAGSAKLVFIVNDHQVHSVPVETGPAHGNFIEVSGDLRPGAVVVIRGNERLRSGQAVEIIGR